MREHGTPYPDPVLARPPEGSAGAGGAGPERVDAGRPWWPAVGFGLLAGVLTGFALVGLIAAPLYLWAKATEPGLGLQRPFVRGGLRAAPLVGLAAFALTAALSTRWRLRDLARRSGQDDPHG